MDEDEEVVLPQGRMRKPSVEMLSSVEILSSAEMLSSVEILSSAETLSAFDLLLHYILHINDQSLHLILLLFYPNYDDYFKICDFTCVYSC